MSVYLTDLLLKLGARVPLNMGERAVLLAVCFRADDAGVCGFSQADIAVQLGMSAETVCRVGKRLRAMHLIDRRIPHGISVCVEELEAYRPAAVGSGKTYAGNPHCSEKSLTQSQSKLTENQLTENQPALTERQSIDGASIDGESMPIDGASIGNLTERQFEIDGASITIYKTDIKDTQNRACVREEALTASPGAAAPKPPQDGEGDNGLAAFVADYPEGKTPRDTDKLASAWHDATVNRKRTPKTLMAALERAKASKGWLEQDGRFIPRPEVWLTERGYEAYLTADERITPEQRQAKAIGWLEASIASFGRMGYTPAEIARIRAKATPAVLAGRNPDDAIADAITALKAKGAIAD